MEKETSQATAEKKGNLQLRLIINVLTAAIFFASDLYVMINLPDNIPVLAIITVLFLVAIYFVMDTILNLQKEKRSDTQEAFDSISKSEKASYLLMKKSFDDFAKILEMIDVKSEGATDEIISAQKALSKVIINREKENADALMNSNDHVVEKVTFMENYISELKPAILTEQKEHIKLANDEVVLKQEKLFIELNNMEASMKDAMMEVSTKLSGFQEEIEKMADTLATMMSTVAEQAATSAAMQQTSEIKAEPVTPVSAAAPVVDVMPVQEAAPTVEVTPVPETASTVEEVPVQEITPMPEEVPVVDTTPVPEAAPMPEMTRVMETAGSESDDEIKLEEILSIDDIVNSITDEPSAMDIDSIMSSLETDDTGASDVTLDEIGSLDTDISLDGIESLDADISLDGIESLDTDISLDEIESLDTDISLDGIESLDADISLDEIESLDTDISLDGIDTLNTDINLDAIVEIPVVEEEPVVEEVKAEEPKPVMPDMSNPNKIMTSEEIAALIAGTSEPEEKKEEPVVEEVKVEEPKPPMPDLSNPNKVMTPEEIAALLANM